MPGRKRVLQVSLDEKTLAALVTQLSKKLNLRDELKGIPRIARGGISRTFVLRTGTLVTNNVYVHPFVNGILNRRIQLLNAYLLKNLSQALAPVWLVETSQDFTAAANWAGTADRLRPEVLLSSAQAIASGEGQKFIRVLSYFHGRRYPFTAQVGLLDPGHGVGIVMHPAGTASFFVDGLIHYRDLPAEIT